MKPPRTVKEVLLALALLVCGLVILPILIYVVGQQIIGEYEDGLLGFYEAIADALIEGSVFAWILILWPYLTVQLFRFSLWLRKLRRAVN